MTSTPICYPWHAPLLHDFQQAVALKRLPHALLLHGLSGTGKAAFAHSMAQALLCEQPIDALACQQCRSCHLCSVGYHPDCYVLQPEEIGKVIKIDAVREALAWLALSPQQNRAKVLLITPLEQLNNASANALLKSLEEPTANTTLILVAEQPALVLATLRSRCQLWPMPLPTVLESRAWLATQGLNEVEDTWLTEQGPLTLLARHQAGTLNQQQIMVQQLDDFLTQKLSLLKFSKALQGLTTTDALNWLQLAWHQRIAAALQSNQQDRAQHFCEQAVVITRLKALAIAGANLNWPLQWDALLCQLKP